MCALQAQQQAEDGVSPKRKRRFVYPAVRAGAACGKCPACLNPQWKQACRVRRAEAVTASAGPTGDSEW